jgi:hypothetical protein
VPELGMIFCPCSAHCEFKHGRLVLLAGSNFFSSRTNDTGSRPPNLMQRRANAGADSRRNLFLLLRVVSLIEDNRIDLLNGPAYSRNFSLVAPLASFSRVSPMFQWIAGHSSSAEWEPNIVGIDAKSRARLTIFASGSGSAAVVGSSRLDRWKNR